MEKNNIKMDVKNEDLIQLQQVLTKYVTPLSVYIHGVNKYKLILLVEQTCSKIVDWIHVTLYRVQG
jgi:hypothetical protein